MDISVKIIVEHSHHCHILKRSVSRSWWIINRKSRTSISICKPYHKVLSHNLISAKCISHTHYTSARLSLLNARRILFAWSLRLSQAEKPIFPNLSPRTHHYHSSIFSIHRQFEVLGVVAMRKDAFMWVSRLVFSRQCALCCSICRVWILWARVPATATSSSNMTIPRNNFLSTWNTLHWYQSRSPDRWRLS